MLEMKHVFAILNVWLKNPEMPFAFRREKWYNIAILFGEKRMMVSYKKLWKLLIDKEMNKTDLRNATGISSATMAKMTNSEEVTMSVLNRICDALGCNIGDVVDFVPEITSD